LGLELAFGGLLRNLAIKLTNVILPLGVSSLNGCRLTSQPASRSCCSICFLDCSSASEPGGLGPKSTSFCTCARAFSPEILSQSLSPAAAEPTRLNSVHKVKNWDFTPVTVAAVYDRRTFEPKKQVVSG